ncbi:MAG: DUF4136 domain-containing protein [Acidobacteriota bacterium]|nr:DUF4136 domain-containing protein [Acidobacteriota bacterium]MDP3718232.1 DUF4136 domain-containing protein [Acidobacteriota bacterium]
MRTLTALAAAVALAVTAACATMNVSAHLERGVNFAEFVTYEWGPPDNLPVGDPRLDNNPFFNDYLQGAVEKQMTAKGFTRAAEGRPADLLVHYHASVNQRLDVYGADHAAGYCYGDCQPQVVDFDQGTLVIDIVDVKTKKVIWRGWSQDTMTGVIDNQERLEKQVDEGVTKMFQLLPRSGAALR